MRAGGRAAGVEGAIDVQASDASSARPGGDRSGRTWRLVVGSGCVKALPLPEQYTEGGGATAAAPNGLMVGTASEIVDITFPAFKLTGWFREGGQYTFFDGPGDVIPEGVNTSGTVVGWMTTGPSIVYTIAFQWTREGGLTPLPVADPDEMASEAQRDQRARAGCRPDVDAHLPGRAQRLPVGGREAHHHPRHPRGHLRPPPRHKRRRRGRRRGHELGGPEHAPSAVAATGLRAGCPPTPAATGLPDGGAVAIDQDGTVVGAADGVSLRWSPSAGHPYTVIDGMTVTDIDAGNVVGFAGVRTVPSGHPRGRRVDARGPRRA